jgi:hypothetical protein
MSKTIYAHTPPYTNETVEFERYTNGVDIKGLRADGYVPEHEIPVVTMKEASEIEAIDYKFTEGKLIE